MLSLQLRGYVKDDRAKRGRSLDRRHDNSVPRQHNTDNEATTKTKATRSRASKALAVAQCENFDGNHTPPSGCTVC